MSAAIPVHGLEQVLLGVDQRSLHVLDESLVYLVGPLPIAGSGLPAFVFWYFLTFEFECESS